MAYTAPRPPPARGGIPSWGKALIATGLGCGVVGFIVLLCIIGLTLWMLLPGRQIDTTRIAGKGTEAVLVYRNLEGKTAVGALINRFFVEMQKAQSEVQQQQVPESLRWLVDLQGRQNQKSMAAMRVYIPREVTVTIEGGGGDYVRNTFVAVNPSMLTGMFELMFEATAGMTPDAKPRSHNGHDYLVMKNDSAICFHGGTVLWVQMAEGMPLLLDRIDGKSPPGKVGGAVKKLLAKDAMWDFLAVIGDGGGVTDWLEAPDAPPALRAVGFPAAALADLQASGPPPDENQRVKEAEGVASGEEETLAGSIASELAAARAVPFDLMTIGLVAVSEGKVVGRIDAECAGEAEAVLLAAGLESAKTGLAEKAKARGLVITGASKTSGSSVTMKFQLGGLGRAFAVFWKDAAKKSQTQPPPPP